MSESTANAGPGSQLTDEELAAIEFANASTIGFPSATVDRLLAEIRRLRAQVAGHAERIAGQSELLSRRAEGWTSKLPTAPGAYWYRRKPGAEEQLMTAWAALGGVLVGYLECETSGYRPAELGGEWAGPLSPPVFAPALDGPRPESAQ